MNKAAPAYWRADGDALVLTVKVQPGARSDAFGGVQDGVLKVRLMAPAIEGRANEALRVFLAEFFQTSKTRVEILRGQTGRLKQVRLTETRVSPESLLLQGQKRS